MRGVICDRRYWLLPIILWGGLAGASLGWNWVQVDKHLHEIAADRARFIFKMIESVRLWNARHGGLYARVDETTQPNPHLEIPERDITAPSGKPLTLINPAYMTRQLAGVVDELTDVLIHITSLDPINPGNAAEPWEREALASFVRDAELREIAEFFNDGQKTGFRYMAPLITQQACLQCHKQYQVGDIRGGVSISFSPGPLLAPLNAQYLNLVMIHLGTWLLLSALTWFFLQRFRHQMLQLDAEREHQETLVRQRTEQLQLAASVFTHAREGIMITAADGTIIEVNDAFSRITGYGRDDVLGVNPRILNSGRQDPTFYAAMWRALVEDGRWAGEVWNRRKDGEVYAEMLTISAVHNAGGKTQHYVALFSDITAQKEHQKQLERIAHYDALTGLPNRVLLGDRLHQAMTQAQRRGQLLAVIYLDLDGFKAINDGQGHEVGDQLLVAVAARMQAALREGDTIARLGGDEFVAVLVDLADIHACVAVLTRLLVAAAQPLHAGPRVLKVSASLGVTFYPQDEEVVADQLLRQADQAMYQAKLSGKNRYHIFDAEHDRSVRGYHESLERIRLALTRGELVLHYQPKVNMRTGQVVGAEALIRWQHPNRGLLPPAAFLPVLVDHPLAIELGEWVIDTVLGQIERWHAANFDIPVSVNIGAIQLQQKDFIARLRGLLAAHPGVNPADVELEVLETSALEDVDHISEVMRACLELGVTFALDDFGTGYSSLTYLKRLPARQLKIDKSFVRDMLEDPEDLAILQGVLGLAAAFRREVIAEGVESVQHGEMLLQFGCDLAQGYAIAPAMPAAELSPWSQQWQPPPSWAEQPVISRDDLPVLFAGVEHRAWIRAVEEFLRGERTSPPPLHHHRCRFGQWLDGEGLARHGSSSTFQAIEVLHRRVHALASELLALRDRGLGPEALARLGELDALRDRLLEQLEMLTHGTNRLSRDGRMAQESRSSAAGS